MQIHVSTVKSLKNSLSLNFVIKNKTGKYNPPASSQIEYLWKIASDGMANIITNEIQQKIESPANRNNAILEIAYKISFLLAPVLYKSLPAASLQVNRQSPQRW